MIYVVRTGRPEPGKVQEFVDWATRVAKYWGSHYPEVRSIEACRPLSGERNIVRWIIKLDSLAAWEKTMAQNQADAEWQKLREERLGIMAPGLTDTFYEIRE